MPGIDAASPALSAGLRVARYAVVGTAPPLTRAAQVAETLRLALMARSDAAPVFSGRGPDGGPARGQRHAFFSPEANGGHERITHITVHASQGFDWRARRALERVQRLWCSEFRFELLLLGIGERADFAGTNVRAGHCALLSTSTRWASRTPFVCTRHPKRRRDGSPRRAAAGRWIGAPEHDVVRLLEATGLPAPVAIEPFAHTQLGRRRALWSDFHVRRGNDAGRRGPCHGCGFRVDFREPVTGPIALGYGAHYGLGTFVPVPR